MPPGSARGAGVSGILVQEIACEWGFAVPPKSRGRFLGGPTRRIVIFSGLYWGHPIHGPTVWIVRRNGEEHGSYCLMVQARVYRVLVLKGYWEMDPKKDPYIFYLPL